MQFVGTYTTKYTVGMKSETQKIKTKRVVYFIIIFFLPDQLIKAG